jgi:glycosyltransferase involved in cell wall biosynthesis
MARSVKVTLVSNINHSVYAARALQGLGVLDRYLGPVVVDSESRWPHAASRFAGTRAFDGVRELPLRRLAAAEAQSRIVRRLPLDRQLAARLAAAGLDRMVAPRIGRPDILHLHTSSLTRTVRRAKRVGALVIADHRDVHPRAHDYIDPLLDGLEAEFEAADWVLANSRLAAQSLMEWGVPEHKVVRLPLGVDVDVFTPAAVQRRHPGDTLQLLFVGSVIPRKGVDVLLAALGHDALDTARLRLCGPAVDAELAARCAATAQVTCVGSLDRGRLVDEYRAADVLVLPSRRDAFGLVAVEALACGTPVVVTSACGVSDLVTPEVGRVVPPGDAAALAAAIAEVAALGRDRRTVDWARHVAANASWVAYEGRLAEWYEAEVLSVAVRKAG